MSPVNIQEMLIGFGKNKQADIATPNVVGGIWRLGKLNSEFGGPNLKTEDDADELGKGHEFATQLFKTNWDVAGSIEKYSSSDFAAWAMAFGLGKCVKTGAGENHIYTCTPLDPVADGLELPYFSFVEQLRPGAGAVLDRMAIGCAIEDWTLTVGSGPGRANSKLVVNYAGSGKHAKPSGIELPAAIVEKLLPSASLACTINGHDYVTAKNFVSLTASWKNNLRLDSGFYPGSGFQGATADTGAIRGRLEVGKRVLALQFVARFAEGSEELDDLEDLAEGTAVVGLTYDANNNLVLTYHRLAFGVVELGNADGLVTVQVTCTPMMHSANGLLTAVAKCNTDGIAQAEV